MHSLQTHLLSSGQFDIVLTNQIYWTRWTVNVSFSSHRTINDASFQPNRQQNFLTSHHSFQIRRHKTCHQLAAKVMCFKEIIDEWGGCGGVFKTRHVENRKGKKAQQKSLEFFTYTLESFFPLVSSGRRYFSHSPGVSFYPICTNCKYFMVLNIYHFICADL